jgi:DNA gyrase subunit A
MGMTTKEEDYIEQVVSVHSHSTVMMFTNTGKVQCIRGFMIPEASRTAKGTNVVNLLQLTEGEKITSMIAVGGFPEGEYLVMVTKNGVIKRTLLSEYEYQRKGGKIALTLDEGDELVYARHTTGSDEIIIATKYGNAVRFDENDARVMGRTARGVRGVRLSENDYVVGVALVNDDALLLTVTENGFGKRSRFSDFITRNRGGKGVYVHGLSDKTGALAAIATVSEEDDVVLVSSDGITIRTHVSDISVYSRSASGVIVMRLSDGGKVCSLANVGKPEEETESENGEVTEGEGETLTEGTENTVSAEATAEAENTEVAENADDVRGADVSDKTENDGTDI